jgi:non-specific protein-tyrosine kinase
LNPVSPITEAYRILRTNVKFASIDKPLETLMVTSPGPAEGKSVTLANLGVVLAQGGDRVIIVDTDLRRPAQHKLFQLSNETGLTDAILSPDADISDVLRPTSVEGLSVLTSGPIPPNPAELLASERMTRLMETLKARADVLLFDCPPALVVTDAVILGAKVDGVLVVNDLNRTRRKMAQKVPDVLERGRANVLGLVLNRLPARNGYGYYYMQYYYADQSPHEKAKVPWWRRLLSRNSREDAKPAVDNNGTDEDARRTALRRSVTHQAPNGDAKGVE